MEVKYLLKSRKGTILFYSKRIFSFHRQTKTNLIIKQSRRVTEQCVLILLPALVLTIKPRQTNTQCYRVIQLRSVSTRSIEGRALYLTEIISHIGERVTSSTDKIGGFSKCHGICRNNNEVSFVTNILVLHVTNAGKFRLNMNFWLSLIEEETNKLLRRSNMFPFFI